MYYGIWPPYGYGLYRHRFPFLLSPFGAVTDDAIGTLSFIEATTPEYVSLQSKYQLLQQQLNQSQAQLKQIQTVNDQLHGVVSQENATINRLNQHLASADRTTLTYQLLAVGFGIIALILAAFSFLERRAKEKMRKTAEPSTSEQTGT
jgi:chromosome segregation ATPase